MARIADDPHTSVGCAIWPTRLGGAKTRAGIPVNGQQSRGARWLPNARAAGRSPEVLAETETATIVAARSQQGDRRPEHRQSVAPQCTRSRNVVRDRRDAAERDVGDGNRKGNKLKGFDHVDRTQRIAENRLWTKFHFRHAEAEMGLGETDAGELRFAA